MAGEHLREGRAAGGDVAFDGVGEGVDTGVGADALGGAGQQVWVEDGDVEARFAVAAGHFGTCVGAGNQGVGLGLAARTGCGGDADGGKHGLGGFAVALVVLHLAVVGEQEIDALGAVHSAAAAQGDDQVDGAVGAGVADAGGYVFGRGIFPYGGKSGRR